MTFSGSLAGLLTKSQEALIKSLELKMNAKRLYELLDGKLPLKDCVKLSPYCEESYYGWPIKGVILDGQYAY